jgi:type IV pilus assembly protein PilB
MSEENRLLGAQFVAAGLLSQEALDDALDEQAKTGKFLGRVLIERGLVTDADLYRILAPQLGLQFVDLTDYSIDSSAVGLISESLARRYQALPVGWEDGKLVLAMADPGNVFAIDDIRTITKSDVRVIMATPDAIQEAIDRHTQMDGEAENISAQAASEMHEKMRPPKNIQSGIISRLKIMAEINIAERRIPQDGRINVVIGGKAIDLRVATLPTVYGEKVVMRILDKSTAVLKLTDLGFLESSRERFEQSYKKPYGTILVTGPTGSGKSTTLYATLNVLNEDSKNIITVEDPVEYRLPGINQVQVNNKAGMTFAAALRSILRSDPDIVLVGEIRDKETATIAIEAALTGHLVLSTLHTNDAATTPTRLVEMGVEPFLVASALDCIVAQRLARKLCDKCKESYRPTPGELQVAGWDLELFEGDDAPELFRAVGCSSCGRTGYHGRFALHEVMTISEEIERMIVEREHSEDIKKMSMAQGMLTLRQVGLIQVRAGKTSLEEILRVVA